MESENMHSLYLIKLMKKSVNELQSTNKSASDRAAWSSFKPQSAIVWKALKYFQ